MQNPAPAKKEETKAPAKKEEATASSGPTETLKSDEIFGMMSTYLS